MKNTLGERFALLLDFDFFEHPAYSKGLKEDLIVRLELNSSEKLILYNRDATTAQKLSEVFLKYNVIFDESNARVIDGLYVETKLP